jgi:hypothetical protein
MKTECRAFFCFFFSRKKEEFFEKRAYLVCSFLWFVVPIKAYISSSIGGRGGELCKILSAISAANEETDFMPVFTK